MHREDHLKRKAAITKEPRDQKNPLIGQSVKGCGTLRIIPSNKQRLITKKNPVSHTRKTPRNYGTPSMKYVLEKQIMLFVKSLENDGHKIRDPVVISEAFNNYFFELGCKLGEATGVCSNYTYCAYMILTEQTFTVNPTDSGKVCKLLVNLSKSIPLVLTAISNELLDVSAMVIRFSITKLFNCCISNGIFLTTGS